MLAFGWGVVMDGVLNLDRLAKVLALADSPSDGEALAAMRLAQQMLGARGMTFADLGTLLARADTSFTPHGTHTRSRAEIDVSRGIIKAYEVRIVALEKENALIKKDLAAAERMMERWKNLAVSTGSDSAKHLAAAEKWRNLARTTADHLWELGRQLQAVDESPPPSPETQDPANVVRLRSKQR